MTVEGRTLSDRAVQLRVAEFRATRMTGSIDIGTKPAAQWWAVQLRRDNRLLAAELADERARRLDAEWKLARAERALACHQGLLPRRAWGWLWRVRRLALSARWLADEAAPAVAFVAVLSGALLWLLLSAPWAGLRSRPGPAAVAAVLVGAALVAGWLVGR